uniref:Uncharacterized protein n=1 Tax=Tanacetum cinerariifolium TaxID=118510 RepID=A0A699RPX1_TANCI|nr:hypothetical protein [Tanacetum cinerariifolium]
MLTAIAGRRWVIGHGLRLATMKCAESIEMRQAFADVVSTGIAKGMSKGLKHGVEHGHASRRSSPLRLTIRRPKLNLPQPFKIKLVDAIAANISRAEQKKRSHIVCRTHGVGSTHYARSDRVPVSAPIVVPQGLSLILVDAATQTDSDA